MCAAQSCRAREKHTESGTNWYGSNDTGLYAIFGRGNRTNGLTGCQTRPKIETWLIGCEYVDMRLYETVSYTFLPLIGLRHFTVMGGPYPKPLIGARLFGVSDGLSIGDIAFAGTWISTWLGVRMWRSPLRRDA